MKISTRLVMRLVILYLPLLLAGSCGNGGSTSETPIPVDGCICPCGTTLFRVRNGLYKTQSVQDLGEDCGLGLTKELLSGDRIVATNYANGELSVTSADGAEVLGTGPLRCNEGKLLYGKAGLQREGCVYDTSRSSTITVTADSTFTLKYTETQTQFRAAGGLTCTPPPGNSCRISFTLYLKM